MGANMMRQWQPLIHAELPLVTTGHEPIPFAPDFCPGVNLLTAFVAWGADTHEDALIISESAAARLATDFPLAVGDKLSHRHGSKGIISRILPDSEMPHLPDGTPIDLCYSFFSITSRMNHGQLLEAVWGWAASVDKLPAVAAPFASPSWNVISERLQAAHLPANGMICLTHGKGGLPLDRESTVGYVYWGRTNHDARTKVQVTGKDTTVGQSLGLAEYLLLREAGAEHLLTAFFKDQAQDGGGQRFNELQKHLATVGIAATRTDAGITFAFVDAPPSDAPSPCRTRAASLSGPSECLSILRPFHKAIRKHFRPCRRQTTDCAA